MKKAIFISFFVALLSSCAELKDTANCFLTGEGAKDGRCRVGVNADLKNGSVDTYSPNKPIKSSKKIK